MKRTNLRLGVCICLLVLNLMFIWANSMLPAELSAAFSRWVRNLLLGFSGTGGGGGTGIGLLRKVAHFSEFACLGFLLGWLAGMLKKRKAAAWWLGFAAACADECIQFLAPGRAPRLTDVLIDTAGVLAGLGMLALVQYIRKTINSRESCRRSE